LRADGSEDVNANGLVDAGETSPINADTDGDGTSDLVETALQPADAHWATDPAMNPSLAGIFYFTAPYSVTGSAQSVPASMVMVLSTTGAGSTPSQVDVYSRASGGLVPVDLVASLLQKVEPNPAGGTDPITTLAGISFSGTALIDRYHGPKALTGAGDIKETIGGVATGGLYAFTVVPLANTSIPATADAQVFTVASSLFGDSGGTAYPLVGSRTITFIVPPSPP
jgi:hypothetical protein